MTDAAMWVAIAPAIGLVLLGAVLIAAPRLGAAVYGLPAPEGAARGYVPALGLRDLAFGSYILALTWFSGRRAVGIVLSITVLIPVGDILVLLAQIGPSSPWHLALHGASGLYMAGAAAWVLGTDRGRNGGST